MATPTSNSAHTNQQHNKVYIFGGTFDPFTEGHLSVIHSLQSCCGLTVIAPTIANPDKQIPPAPLELRIEMIRLILAYEEIPYVTETQNSGIYITNHPYVWSVDFIDWWRNNKQGEPTWVVSEDLKDSYKNWKDWDKRGCDVIVLPIINNIHATDVRAGRQPYHPAIREFIAHHRLYTECKNNLVS